MRAQKRPNQIIDVVRYAKYYLFLEAVVSYYKNYELRLSEIELARKDNHIGSLETKVDHLLNENKEQTKLAKEQSKLTEELLSENKNQSKQIDKLLNFGKESKIQMDKMNSNIEAMFEFIVSFARMSIPTWIGSSVIHKQYESLMSGHDEMYALKHLKVLFVVGFFVSLDEVKSITKTVAGEEITFQGRTAMKIYLCCTNFGTLGNRIKELYARHTGTDQEMLMLHPKVISLISCEINMERNILETFDVFPAKSTDIWISRYKRYDVVLSCSGYQNVDDSFNDICNKITSVRFQGYQLCIDEHNKSSTDKVNDKIMEYLDSADSKFYTAATPYSQQYLNNYICENRSRSGRLVEWMHTVPSRKLAKYPDISNIKMTKNTYLLRKIEQMILEHNKVDHVEYMVRNSVITKDDYTAIKKAAKYSNVDLPDFKVPTEEWELFFLFDCSKKVNQQGFYLSYLDPGSSVNIGIFLVG